MTRYARGAGALLCAALLAACGGAAERDAEPAPDGSAAGLTEDQLEKGIGPIEDLDIDEDDIEPALAAKGAEIFSLKCSACHQLDDRYVGPPLGRVAEARTPEYIMNMMLNPAEMLERHPTARALLAQYYTPMPSQDLTQEDARALLEYLRQANAERDTDRTGEEP